MIGFLNTWRLYLEVGVLAVLLVALGAQHVEVEHERAGRATDQLSFDKERIRASEARIVEVEAARVEEQRRTAAIQGKTDEAEKKLAVARADIAVRDAAAGRLQQRVAALVTAAREAARDPAPAVTSTTAEDPAGMLADVLGRCVARVRLLATVADERGIAGGLAEQAYDSLK